ncbi:sulfurtransferase [Microbacterium sediminicola]|uniref:Sulfurtransferase n=1 Tax=Microbacterium sediminicola TaxID=415210 RepID=A0ABN2HX31_9MICO
MTTPLITAEELRTRIGRDAPIILDVRWRLDAPDGRDAYLAGHIPGAHYVSLDDELAAHGAPTDGRHPLPSAEAFAEAVHRWGIDDGDEVIVYDDWLTFGAARAWWMLADAGIRARVLDGGLAAWRSVGGALETGDTPRPEPGRARLEPGQMRQLSMDEAAALPQHGLLFDVRAPERYRGDVEPMDPRAGHIPGAGNAPTTQNATTDGRFLAPDLLRERFEALGVSEEVPLGVYCGSGVSAAHAALALTLAGFTPALYAGSWSQWSNHPDRPVAVGGE